MSPVVSVIIPHYQRVPRVLEALDSVHSQTFCDWEVIVVDDCSPTDPTDAIVEAFPKTRVIRHAVNGGPGAARNSGIRAARGRFVAFLDSDDLWEPAKLRMQVDAMLARPNPDKALCVTLTRVIEGQGRERVLPTRGVSAGEHFADFLYVNRGFAQASSMMLARSAATELQFREDLRQYEDHLFFIEAGNAGLEYVLVDRPLVTWHNDERPDRLTHSGNLHKGEMYLNVAEASLGRKACAAFRAKFLGPDLFRASPRQALAVIFDAYRLGVISTWEVSLLALKILLPDAVYRNVRGVLARKPAAS